MEVLFYTFLIAVSTDRVTDTRAWAKKVHSYKSAAEALEVQWVPPKDVWLLRNSVSTIFDPMEAAFNGVRNESVLENVAAAMRRWDGPGRADILDGKMLSNYFYRGLHARGKTTKKPKGPPRWRSWMIVYVAEHIHTSWRALRQALNFDDMEPEEVPTAHERAVAAEARVAELESEKSKLAVTLAKAIDAKRKAAARNKEAVAKKAAAKKAAREKAEEKAKAKITAETERLAGKAERALEKAEERLEADYADDKVCE